MLILKRLIFFFGFIFVAASADAQKIDKSLFGNYQSALIIQNRLTGEVVNLDPSLGARRLPPCSTFKIYNTLIGLELGLISDPDAPWYQWDGVHRDIEGWNQDLTLRQAFKVSAVPAFQSLARQIGVERMKKYIQEIGYGTQDLSPGVDMFWLPRSGRVSIQISAEEQVALLSKLLDGQLPFSQENIATLKEVMKVVQTDKGTLYGKTGSGAGEDGQWNLGWFVGFLESGNTTYIFACNITEGESPSGKTARALVEAVFKAQGLL